MRALLTLAVGAALLAFGGVPPAANAAAQQPAGQVVDPTGLVNPFIGTGSGGTVVGPVDMFPGAAMPFGMLTWSPDTPSRPASGGYSYNDSSTIGLSVTHLSGAGCDIAGDLPILPTVGAISTNPAATTEPFSHANEQASPGYYATRLGTTDPIGVRLSATTRTGIGEFDFPATTAANMLFKVGDSQGGNTGSTVDVVGDNQVTGSISGGHFCGAQNTETVYFAAQFDRPFSAYGTWNGTQVSAGARTATRKGTISSPPPSTSSGTVAPRGVEAKGSQRRTQTTGASGPSAGAWVSFDTTQQNQVLMKVSISYVSTANAWANLRAEDSGWSVNSVADQAHAAWQRLLSQVSVGGGTHDQQVEFYTALYHTLLDPSVFSDDNGQYIGFDNAVHTIRPGWTQYANFSGWDIYRSEVPLLALLAPQQTSQMMQSLVNDAAQGGWLPKWPAANGYTGVMDGDSADPIIAEAYAFGARNFDTTAALAAMVKGATVSPSSGQLGQGWYEERPQLSQYEKLGYVPNTSASSISAVDNGASETLEYAADDFGISRFADAIGARATARAFLKRSQNWTNLYNVDSGYLQPRDGNGDFPAGDPVTTGMSSFGQSGFQEGNAAQYAWAVPQDLRGLITAMGGDATVDQRLDQFFTQLNVGPNDPYYWAGNETDLLAPWLYDYAGEPYKTQALVRRIDTSVYADTPGGEPGNDDLGAMSSWFVWSALGLYPETPGTSVLAVTTPLFPTISLRLSGNHVTRISAPNAASDTYVGGLTINGRGYGRDWIAADLLTGAAPTTLTYQLSSQPNTGWAASAADEPPSYQDGRLAFPPGLTPVDLTTSPTSTVVTAGSSTNSALTFDVGAGSQVANGPRVTSIAWKMSPPSGITVTPASGTSAVGPDGSATVAVRITAASGAQQGFDTIPVTLTSSPSVPLPQLGLSVAVVGTGEEATTCTTLGATNTDAGLSQVEASGDGVTTPVTVGGQTGRRTVQVVVNDLNMYFLVDPRLAENGDFTATFTVTYYDSGTNAWTLQYDSTDHGSYAPAITVTDQGSDTWKTATVTVPDARFNQGENSQTDFRVSSPQPVTIHGVQVSVSGTGVLPMDLCPAGGTS